MIEAKGTRRFRGSVGASFTGWFDRAAVIYERAARDFRTLPEVRGFLLQQASVFRQAALSAPVGDEGLRRMAEAILVATEHYLDEIEVGKPTKKSHVVPGPFHVEPELGPDP